MSNSRPKVTRRDSRLQLSYTIQERIYCSHVYARSASNGSTVIIIGHENGLRVVWRNKLPQHGRSRQTADSPNNGKDAGAYHPEEPVHNSELEFGDEIDNDDEDMDVEDSLPQLSETVDIAVDGGVLAISVPAQTPSIQGSRILEECVIVVASCSDRSLRVFYFPIDPPTVSDKANYAQYVHDQGIQLEAPVERYPTLAAKVVPRLVWSVAHPDTDDEVIAMLAVASAVNQLQIHWLAILDDRLVTSSAKSTTTSILPSSVTSLAWHPSSHRLDLLLGDRKGAIRIFSAATAMTTSRPSSQDSILSTQVNSRASNKWLHTFHAPYSSGDVAGGARRKPVLSVAWIMEGQAILVLLEDGQWGVWDVSESGQSTASLHSFAIQGFLGAVGGSDSVVDGRQRRAGSKLAPMTPNTRKAKADNLFNGPAKVAGAASTGGIDVAVNISERNSRADETVAMWYNAEIYSIPNVHSFWQRNLRNGGTSLHASSPSHVSNVNLMNENIIGVADIASRPVTANHGVIHKTGDLLISTEHRLIFLQTRWSAAPTKGMFQQALEQASRQDQNMLDAGNLDIGGMDRMLDSMANGDARGARRVGFAH